MVQLTRDPSFDSCDEVDRIVPRIFYIKVARSERLGGDWKESEMADPWNSQIGRVVSDLSQWWNV